MNTHSRAEQVALHGLLLLVVEVQNILCDEDLDSWDKLSDIEDIAESSHARELIQLARAALETRADNGNAHNHS